MGDQRGYMYLYELEGYLSDPKVVAISGVGPFGPQGQRTDGPRAFSAHAAGWQGAGIAPFAPLAPPRGTNGVWGALHLLKELWAKEGGKGSQ